MWLFTRYGFFSIACASKPDGTLNHDQVMIRARRDAHLQALQYRFPQLREYKSLVFDNRDYRYRLIIPKDVWIDVLTGIAREQEWSNFKDEAGRFQGSKGEDYLKVLSRIWTITRELQDPTRPNTIQHVGISDEAALLAERLATAAKTVCGRHQAEIDEMKQKSLAFWQAEDFIWESLLLSAATL